MKELLKEIPLAQYILSLPGMGKVGCAVFLGELGNPEHFKNPRQIIKYAGYDPKENDSGLRVGRKIISKKGRWLLRKCLFFMVLTDWCIEVPSSRHITNTRRRDLIVLSKRQRHSAP